MPCNDSSSGLNIRLDLNECLVDFDFAKITCSREITGNTGYAAYCKGQTLEEILKHDYFQLVKDLKAEGNEEKQFILHLEWDALRSGIAQYLGLEHESIDPDRCRITSIEQTDQYIEIAQVILPPKEMPKILPCSLADKKNVSNQS
jgi:hypothetical protein